jgi:hypothetical protein
MQINSLDSATKRVSEARTILLAVKNKQSTDGAFDFPHEFSEEFKRHLDVLCINNFIQKCEVADDGFPYRITWKGHCFLDVCDLYDQISKKHPSDSPQGVMVQLAMFSFH